MVERSLRASPEGKKAAKTALIGSRLTQQQLADALGVTRQPVNRFFNSKPVTCELFVRICEQLKLDWQAIAQKDDELEGEQNRNEDSDIDALVQEIREKVKPNIRERCGTMRVLDMTQPIELTGERGIYTNVNILEKITGRRRLETAELLQNCDPENFERFGLNRVSEKRVPGLEAVQRYSKLMVLGKPGAGKTTFLKYLAMQCSERQFQTNQVPLFITLKDFAEAPKKPNLLEYIAQQLSGCEIIDASVKAEQLLRHGRAFVLLDGLDEVRNEDNSRVLRQIREFAAQLRDNNIVITCRIAAREYVFKRFTEVEIADFDDQQISTFATQWFQIRKPTKIDKFLQKLEENQPIKELATNPLLLTLLCLIFEEKGKFKNNRTELYEEGIELLLEKWDDSRDIEREQIYRNLSTRRKEDLLSKIAFTTFTAGNYFFKNRDTEQLISEYIYNLPDAQIEPTALCIDSKKVLKSIAAQHGLLVERAKGIYSYSHLTFQEYFAAREIDANSVYASLVEYITEKRWREVFLLTAGMMRKADELMQLMKQKIDDLLAEDERLQEFLDWVNQKSLSVETSYKISAVRAFYFYFSCGANLYLEDRSIDEGELDMKLDCHLNWIYPNDLLETEIAIDKELFFIISLEYNNHLVDFHSGFNDLLACNLKPELRQVFQRLKHQLSACDLKPELRQTFKQLNYELLGVNKVSPKFEVWNYQLRMAMLEHRNIGHEWQFSEAQKQLLQEYYDANKLLVDCLNSDCYVSREIRQEIEDTLLLPMSEIEKRQQGKVS